MSRLIVLCALLAAVLAVGSSSPGRSSPLAADFFLKITGIDGEGADGSIALAGFAWNTTADVGRFVTYPFSQPSEAGSLDAREAASGMATGRRMHKPFTIVKEWDRASPKLMEMCANGTPVGDVEVWSREGEQTTLRYTLQDAIISSYRVSRAASALTAASVESVSFSFGAVQVAGVGTAAETTVKSSKSNSSD